MIETLMEQKDSLAYAEMIFCSIFEKKESKKLENQNNIYLCPGKKI
ncbi:MAG: hypothetical protein LBD28_01765 [Tannerellaceae bacterium]|jgi:hypothetical protein|nr:hypothetical protein [Tannerellaceae bacterium]